MISRRLRPASRASKRPLDSRATSLASWLYTPQWRTMEDSAVRVLDKNGSSFWNHPSKVGTRLRRFQACNTAAEYTSTISPSRTSALRRFPVQRPEKFWAAAAVKFDADNQPGPPKW